MKFDFDEWLSENTHVWIAFERQALLVHQRGYRHYSARTIIEFLRHHTATKQVSEEWKINDHAVPHLARKFMEVHPNLNGFFEVRGLK
jgi:hypothetical protein